MRSLYEDPELRARLGERAAQTASRYTWDENGRQFRELFSRILREKTNRDK
jgi:glycosyltransferase involved in cell wall biosynthesis